MFNCAIICSSVHHQNTLRIAKALSEELGAEIFSPSDFEADKMKEYDLVGFGSGIYNGSHHQSLLKLAEELQPEKGKKVFVFSSSTIIYKPMHEKLKTILREKEYDICGEFFCKGYMSYSFIKLFGGLNRGRPNAEDLGRAREFAKKITIEYGD